MGKIKEIYNKLQNLPLPWVQDPKNKKPSVSLTLLIFSVFCVLIAGGLQVAGKVDTLGPFSELMYSSIALYFGRRIKVSGKEYEGKEE